MAATSRQKLIERALTHPPNPLVGHGPRRDLYRKSGFPLIPVAANQFITDLLYDDDTMGVTGIIYVQDGHGRGKDYEMDGTLYQDLVKIAFTMFGDQGPVMLSLHGVPTNRTQYYDMMRREAPFVRGIAIDMLGMGESDMPRPSVGRTRHDWRWSLDAEYILNLMQALFPVDQQFIFRADDWGGGSAVHYAAKYPETLSHLILIDPVAFDGYPVAEIQAIGRASEIPDDATFQMGMGAFDQTLTQILKTMVYDPNVWNQYNLRAIKKTYVNVDYLTGISGTMGLNFENLRVLADRSWYLGGPQLLPWAPDRPDGVRYERITMPTLVLWGEFDNMMPEAQRYRFLHAIQNARVDQQQVPRAGHFAAVDQPDIVSSKCLGWLSAPPENRTMLADVFIGYDSTIWKGDEREMIADLRLAYGAHGPITPMALSPITTSVASLTTMSNDMEHNHLLASTFF